MARAVPLRGQRLVGWRRGPRLHGAVPVATRSRMGPLSGVRVVDLTDRLGRFGARLLADLGAEVVRVEGEEPETGRWPATDAGALLWLDGGKRVVGLGAPLATALEHDSEVAALIAAADIVLDGRPQPGVGTALRPELSVGPGTVVVRLTPFGASGPRRTWQGSDMVIAARGGMVATNGHADGQPLQPFGQQAYNASGIWACMAALLALRVRAATGLAPCIDLAAQAAVVASLEHATGLWRQSGLSPHRQGTLHWTRSFRVGPCSDGLVLHTLYGDWTSQVEWVCSEADEPLLREPRFEVPDVRAAEAEALFDVLDRFSAHQARDEFCDHAALLRLPCVPVRAPGELAADVQLRARGASEVTSAGRRFVLPPPPAELSATPLCSGLAPAACDPPRTLPEESETDGAQHRAVVQAARAGALDGEGGGARREEAAGDGRALPPPLAGLRVLDFTWVVAGPVTTRILADQGASVVKIERRGAPDFGDRRGGLSGNLNRGKQSLVLDMAHPEGREIARALAARSDVVIDNFSSRVMTQWGLDYPSLRALRPDVIALRMTGFGMTGPRRDEPSYGPTLQALAALPLLMRHPGEPPTGYGWSWSDTAAGLMGALLVLAALHHRDRRGEGQLIDLSQYANLVGLLGPTTPDLLAGRVPNPVGNDSQEGAAVPHGLFRCAPRGRPAEARAASGSRGMTGPDEPTGIPAGQIADDDRWLAIVVPDATAWRALAGQLADDGESWALDVELVEFATRVARRAVIDRNLAGWTRRHDAEELEARLQAAGVPAALVATGEDLCRDPTLRDAGFFARVPASADAPGVGAGDEEATGVAVHVERGRRAREVQGQAAAAETQTRGATALEFDGIPFHTTAGAGRIAAPGPLLGEHGSAILGSLLGFSTGRIADLRARGIVG